MILKILLLHIQQHDRYCKTLILDMLLLNNILYIYIYFFYAYFLWINFMHKNTFYGKPSWTRKSYQIKVHPHNHNIYLRVFSIFYVLNHPIPAHLRIFVIVTTAQQKKFSSQCWMLSLSIFLQDDLEIFRMIVSALRYLLSG